MKNILILNGNPDKTNDAFDNYLNNLQTLLENDNFQVKNYLLREMNLKYCLGCWNCWLKTPGQCTIMDSSKFICREYINADFVLFASPLIMGFTSALLKKMTDKFVQLLHPYIRLVEDEVHHMKRYEKYPPIGLIYEREEDTNDEDIDILKHIYSRNAINLNTKIYFISNITESIINIKDEINYI